VRIIARELRLADNAGGSLVARVKLTAQTLAQRFAAPTLDGDQVAPEDIWAAAELLLPLAHRVGDDRAALLQEIETGAEVDALDPRAEAVNLLTLHAAKGLEFPVVFLVGCEDGLLPLRWPGRTPADDEVAEERRLFFVGLTRAQDRLFVSHAARRFRHGSEREQSPTPFLDAIDSGLFERLGDTVPARPRDRQLRLL
jgi:superfamily I DNA/RNA helicase